MNASAEGTPRPKREVEWLGVVSLTLGLLRFALQLPLVGTIIGFVSGIVALVRIKKSRGALVGKVPAVSGVILAFLILVRFSLVLTVSSARESARRATCVANEQKMFRAIQLYADEHDGKYPNSPNELRAYLTREYDLVCPMEPDIKKDSYILVCDTNSPNGVMIRESGNRHFGGSNVAYADGRIVWESAHPTHDRVVRYFRLLFLPECLLDLAGD